MSAEAEEIARVVGDLTAGRVKYTTTGKMQAAALSALDLASRAAAGLKAPVVDCCDIFAALMADSKRGREYDAYHDFVIAPPWKSASYCYVNDHGNVVVMLQVAIERDGPDDDLFQESRSVWAGSRYGHDSPTWETEHDVDWDRVRWTLDTFIWVGGRSSKVGPMPTHGPLLLWRWAVYEDGAPADLRWIQLHEKLPIEEWDIAYLVLLSAMNLLNCQNVDVVDYLPKSRHERKRIERTGTIVSTIHVFPAGKRRRAGDRGEPLGVTHHGVRGHFASYGPKYGRGLLFGRLEGRFFIPAHVRGRKDLGEIEQDYQLHPERP